jgi:hypothetical protein
LLQTVLGAYLKSAAKVTVQFDGVINSKVLWRPHLLDKKAKTGWYIHVGPPLSESWAERIKRAKDVDSKIRVGVAGTEELFEDEEFLEACHALNASILLFREQNDKFVGEQFFNSIDDLIYSRRLKLSNQCAKVILDRCLERAISEKDKNKKGVLLEVLVAVLLSQVDGFEVTSVGISNRSQQMDVLVHNRNVGGSLGGSPVVIAEAKNWKNPVTPTEYSHFLRKLESRHGRAKLGYLITTGRFTAGVISEVRRESKSETLVVLIDGKLLPTFWHNHKNITSGFERTTVEATVGL